MLKTVDFPTACGVLGMPQLRPQVSTITDNYQKLTNDFYEMNVLADAINKERNFVPDFTNRNQRKYSVWFWYDPSSGVGFSYDVYDRWGTCSAVGSRLCFDSSEMARYFGEMVVRLKYQI